MHRFLRSLAAAMLALLVTSPALAAGGYRALDGPQPANDPDKIEVIEFFWYGCPHCYRFEPMIQQWAQQEKAPNVEFRHVPAILSRAWELHGRAFYAAKVMGVLDRFHQPMFDKLHEDHRGLSNEDEIRDFVDSLGIDGDQFVKTMNSFAVDTKIRRARSLQKAYGVSGTPTVVIDGRYVTSGSMAGSLQRMIQVINDRVAAARSESG